MKQPYEPDYEVVVYMTDPEARYVSLVKRGANRTPFHIVKHQKEREMKIIQRIVAKKGVEIDAIKAAVGEDASSVLNLTTPKESGAYAIYEQHPESAFKSDTLSVIALSEDNSILGICGEMVEKSEGFVEKLFTKKSERQGVSIADTVKPIDTQVLKSAMCPEVWAGFSALQESLANVLKAAPQEGKTKLEMLKSECDSFLKSVETVISLTQSEDFGEPVTEQPTDPVESEPTLKKEPDLEKESDPGEVEKFATAFMAQVNEKLEAISKTQKESLDAVKKSVAELGETVGKLQKAPVGVVASHEDTGVPTQKTQKEKNVFAGCFGRLR